MTGLPAAPVVPIWAVALRRGLASGVPLAIGLTLLIAVDEVFPDPDCLPGLVCGLALGAALNAPALIELAAPRHGGRRCRPQRWPAPWRREERRWRWWLA